MTSPKPSHFSRPHRIRFSECDPAGIVFYPQYFILFNDLMEAWIDALLPIGFSGFVRDRCWGLPTVSLEAQFKGVSRMGDDVVLTLDVAAIGTRSLALNLACTGHQGDLRMQVKQTVVTTSLKTHKPIVIPQELRAAIDAMPL